MDEDIERIHVLKAGGANYIRDYAYQNGQTIYDFMKEHEIGENAWGKLMDGAGKGKHVMRHRLYGHHIIYDLPIKNPDQTPAFCSHIFSDLFTKQGIPILPGELLEHLSLTKYCNDLHRCWLFVNGFDIFAGTIAIYQGGELLKRVTTEELALQSFEDIAAALGVGALELAIAVSTANPFLLIGAMLQLTASIRGLLNDGGIVFFRRTFQGIRFEFTLGALSAQEIIRRHGHQNFLDSIKVDSFLQQLKPRF